MTENSQIDAIDSEYKQFEDSDAWNQVYQVWYMLCFFGICRENKMYGN